MTLLFGAILSLFAWPTPDQVQDAVDGVYQDEGLQREIPQRKQAKMPELSELPPPPRRERRRRSEATATGASLLMWIVMGLCLAAVVVVFAREFMDRPEAAKIVESEAKERAPPVVQVSAQTLGDAQQLARDGRFAEAIRTLLHQTFATIGQQHAFAPSSTSREILGSVPMQPEAHSALGQLVLSVEVTLFGGEAASKADYDRCVSAYQQVLGARGVRVV